MFEENEDLKIVVASPDEISQCPVCGERIEGLILHEDEIWRCPNCHSMAQERLLIRIIDYNREDCPESVRLGWLGTELVAEKDVFYPDDLEIEDAGDDFEIDEVYLVQTDWAMDLLMDKSPEAFQYYEQELENDFSGFLLFWKDEAEVMSSLTLMMSSSAIEAWALMQDRPQVLV